MELNKKILLFLVAALILSACGNTANEQRPTDEPVGTEAAGVELQPAEVDSLADMSPCDVTDQMIGEELAVTGSIEFIDRGDPNGLFIGLFESGCMLGVFIDMATFNQWDESQQAAIAEGSQVTLRGTLTSFDSDLVLEVYAQQEEEAEVDAAGGGGLAGLSIQVSDDPDSRWQEMTITVLDDNGQPVSGVPISISQSDIDFIHSSSNTVWASWVTDDGEWSDDAQEQIQRYRDMGTNNWEFLPWWSWSLYEPADDQWEFYSYSNDWHFTDRPYWQEFFPDARFNTMWVGPQFDREYMVPSWVDYQDDESFRAEFGEFIREAIELNPTGHFDLYGVTVEINNAPTWGRTGWDIAEDEWDWAIDFIAWEVDLIRSLDPDARISIDFDPIIHFDDCEPCRIENWIERIIAAGVEFDVIGLELHPGAYAGSPATVEELDALIQSLDVFGKDYYVWEFGVRSHGEPTQSIFLGELSSPPVLEYNEDYQSQTYVDFLRYFIENPRFLGVRYLKYVDGLSADEEAHALPDNQVVIRTVGLLRADRTPKPAYFAIRDYFQSLYFTGEGQTDEFGRFTFTAIPGIFELVIAGEGEQIHLWAGMDYSLME